MTDTMLPELFSVRRSSHFFDRVVEHFGKSLVIKPYGLRSTCLRYFNAAGALPDHGIGEAHACETHLIPNVLRAALGIGNAMKVFGDDYATPDGTCVRDYVHVQDLAQAHALALEYMDHTPGAHAFNLGNGQGFSVREVIAAAAEVSGRSIPFELAERRPGDPASLVASSTRARQLLGWHPKWTELAPIIESAWQWHRNPPAWSPQPAIPDTARSLDEALPA